jgi:hypothetical protein
MGKGYESVGEACEAYEKLRKEESRQEIQTYIAGVLILVFFGGGLLSGMYLSPILSPPVGSPRIYQFNVASMTFSGVSGTAPNYINMTIQNIGASPWTLTNTAQVNSVTGLAVTDYSVMNGGAYNCTNGNSIRIGIKMTPTAWASGNQYSITLLTTSGSKITYVASAP